MSLSATREATCYGNAFILDIVYERTECKIFEWVQKPEHKRELPWLLREEGRASGNIS